MQGERRAWDLRAKVPNVSGGAESCLKGTEPDTGLKDSNTGVHTRAAGHKEIHTREQTGQQHATPSLLLLVPQPCPQEKDNLT